MHNITLKCKLCNHETLQSVDFFQQNSKAILVKYTNALSAVFNNAKFVEDELNHKKYIIIPECIYCK